MSPVGSFERVSLPLETPFTIARGTTTETENVIVTLEDAAGTVGVGAAAPSAHYGENADTVTAVLPELLDAVEDVSDPLQLARLEGRLDSTIGRNPAAKCAVSIAAHDLVAKRLGIPLYQLWGSDPEQTVTSSYTIGIDTPEAMAELADAAVDNGYDILKVKLGTADDRARFQAVREAAPGARIRVDANEAWTPKEAVEKAIWLADGEVEFIEQPVPASDRSGSRYVAEHAPVPIAVDEAIEVATDVPDVADRGDIVVLKLMKCGGLREARRIIHAARAHGLEVMCGCMVETNAAIAAACHLAPDLDYADLDGSLLLEADPFDGVPMPGGRIDLTGLDRPGTGARRR
jgi:L-alanine-DL-glutamate epimerase-like enolase superfamily enzyme